jgi:hypothetical protein
MTFLEASVELAERFDGLGPEARWALEAARQARDELEEYFGEGSERLNLVVRADEAVWAWAADLLDGGLSALDQEVFDAPDVPGGFLDQLRKLGWNV